MRKWIDLGAMLAMMLVVAAPAVAQVGQGFSERRITSGKASPSTRISNTGDNANICAPVQQVVNTGNVANEQGVIPVYGSRLDDLDFEGSDITLEPSETVECTQTIEQAAAAGPGGEAKAGGAVATAGGAVAAPAPAAGGGGGPAAAAIAPVLAPGG